MAKVSFIILHGVWLPSQGSREEFLLALDIVILESLPSLMAECFGLCHVVSF